MHLTVDIMLSLSSSNIKCKVLLLFDAGGKLDDITVIVGRIISSSDSREVGYETT